ncbi:MAG TPA: prepilin-type N-terminal cleavage/methylation domain-containing protein [Holophagaceae bacterium]|nr:prepilin-type N-terminal cleavage/methylation domain-containing protein [Holophagaceae bacterium]
MSESRTLRRRPHTQGFSLVELLVAIVFLSILMAGMLRLFSSSLSNFVNTTESINIQRSARWGILRVQDDLMQLGYLMPPRIVTDLIGNAQPAIKIETTAAPLAYKDSDGNDTSIPAPDNLEMVMDVPLEAYGTLAAPPALNSTTLVVDIPVGASKIQPNDLMFVADSAWEVYQIASVSGGGGNTYTVSLVPGASLLDQYGNDRASAISPFVGKTHFASAPVEFIRPLQVVRYTILPMSVDPSNDIAQVPCLVRQTKNLSDPAFTNTTPTPEIIVEGVTGLSLDWSLDGGQTWIRKANGATTADWATVKTATNSAFQAVGSTNPFVQTLPDYSTAGLDSNVDPFWFNYVPLVIKVDVETRTRLRRSEFTDVQGTAEYRTRRQTLLISPRNFSLGSVSGS